VFSVVLVFLMGGLAGVAAGFFGGWTDRIVSRIADTIMAFPLSCSRWASWRRSATRCRTSSSRRDRELSALRAHRPHRRRTCAARPASLQAARLSGNGEFRILLAHILPNYHADHDRADVADDGLRDPQTPRPLVHRARRASAAIRVGIMVAEGAAFMVSANGGSRSFPGLALMIAVFCFNLLGDACATSSIRSGERDGTRALSLVPAKAGAQRFGSRTGFPLARE